MRLKGVMLLAAIMLVLSACSEKETVENSEEVTEVSVDSLSDKPIRDWLGLNTNQKNEIMLEELEKTGLEKNEYLEWYRTAIKEMDKMASNPDFQNETIGSGIKKEVEMVLIYIEDTKGRD
ncbi:hypothetical protein V1502_10405 [Bacillus sp. SCS-153A]|uniref:hypothetical protein n=1 Tax=Rossellomorea sedimentorum TaxID=3115294 RepID=UPI0039061AD3